MITEDEARCCESLGIQRMFRPTIEGLEDWLNLEKSRLDLQGSHSYDILLNRFYNEKFMYMPKGLPGGNQSSIVSKYEDPQMK